MKVPGNYYCHIEFNICYSKSYTIELSTDSFCPGKLRIEIDN